MEQDAVKCPVLKWPTQAHCLEPQHEVPLSLSPGHCRAPGLLERRQKSQQVGRQACPEGLGARNGGLLARGAGFRVLEGRLFSLLTNLTWEAEQRFFLFLKHRKGSFLGGCVCVTTSIPAPLSQEHVRVSLMKLPVLEPAEILLTPRMEKGVRKGWWSWERTDGLFFLLSFS